MQRFSSSSLTGQKTMYRGRCRGIMRNPAPCTFAPCSTPNTIAHDPRCSKPRVCGHYTTRNSGVRR